MCLLASWSVTVQWKIVQKMYFIASQWVSYNLNCCLFLSHFCFVLISQRWHLLIFIQSQSIPYSPSNGDYKSLNNGSESRTGRESYDVLKCCDNIKTPTESNSPLNRCIPRYRDEDFIDCQFSTCGCNYRTTDLSQLNNHNEENLQRHMNVSNAIHSLQKIRSK